jgi:prepilin-type N-terminal cleavage/methylation domain-containing protein
MKAQKRGFTFIEIMIVVTTIGLLSAIAVPNFQQARAMTQQNACLNNLKKIDVAKDQYALDNNTSTGVIPSDLALSPYVKGGIQIAKACPSGGSISVNAIGSDPTCTSHSSSSSSGSSGHFSVVTSINMTGEVEP